MGSTTTCYDSLNTGAFPQRATTSSWVTMWIEGSSRWRQSASCWPTRLNTLRTFSCCVGTTSVQASIASMVFMMNVSTKTPAFRACKHTSGGHEASREIRWYWVGKGLVICNRSLFWFCFSLWPSPLSGTHGSLSPLPSFLPDPLWLYCLQVSGAITSNCGKPSLTVSTASLLLPLLMRRSSAVTEVSLSVMGLSQKDDVQSCTTQNPEVPQEYISSCGSCQWFAWQFELSDCCSFSENAWGKFSHKVL